MRIRTWAKSNFWVAAASIYALIVPRRGCLNPENSLPSRLARNTSDLLAGSGYHGWLVRRYVHLARRDVLHALRASSSEPAAVNAFLADAERRRSVAPLAAVVTQVEKLPDRVPAAAALRLATRAHRWKEEMTRAARRRP